MNKYAYLFEAAADEIEAAKRLPGMSMEGVWELDSPHWWESTIGAVIGAALRRVCEREDEVFDFAIQRFLDIKPMLKEARGAPDTMAVLYLREASRKVRFHEEVMEAARETAHAHC